MAGDGASGWLYLLFYVIAVTPGLPIGFALFGRSHAAGWIAGALIGYAFTAYAFWAVIATHVPTRLGFAAAWTIVSVLTWSLTPRPVIPFAPLPRWTTTASTGLLLVLVLTLAIAVPPFANVGRADEQGNRYYRAYFTADFVWHTALTAEMTKFSMPPRNPYLQQQRIHYYWTYYIFPAVVAARGPAPVRDVQRALKANALASGLLLMSAIFVAAWATVGRAVPVAIGTSLVLVSSSAEGLYALYRIWSEHAPLSGVRELNVDAVTAWFFGAHRVDALPRCLWYVPQHGMSYALGLIALAVGIASGSRASRGAIIIAGVALGCSVTFNPFVGGMFALAYGLAVVLDAARQPGAVRMTLRHAMAIVPVLAATGWCAANQMLAGASGVLQFGFLGASQQHPLVALVLSLGPVLAAVVGALAFWPLSPPAEGRLAPAMLAIVLSLLAMYFLQLSVDTEWVAFRSGHLFIVAAAAPAAFFIDRVWRARRSAAIAVLIVCFVSGLPTTVIDAYNARDIHNMEMGPGFPWTIVVTPQQQAAYRWIREHTREGAVVQMDAAARDRATWSNIPSFAERRMAAGLPISLLKVPEYRERSDRVSEMYAATDAEVAADIARQLRIEYVYVDEVERHAHPSGIQFDHSTAFEKVFDAAPAAVYRVR